MHEIDGEENPAADPLAEIVRAAGRRTAPPQHHYDRTFAAAHAAWQRKLRARRQRRWYALAAALAVFAIGGMLWQSRYTNIPPAAAEVLIAHGQVDWLAPNETSITAVTGGGDTLAAGTRMRTGADGAIALRLADGGSLRLGNNTEIILGAAAFRLGAGKLYFDSAGRRPDMTIDVVTPHGTIRDIGTQFEVQTSTDALRVRVRSGDVALLDSQAAEAISGTSGEEIRLSAAGELTRRAFATDDAEWQWTQALAVAPNFAAPTVLRYLQWIADETGKSLDFESENVRLQAELARFLGDPSDLQPTELLVTIAATSDFSYEITDHGTILISRDTETE